MCSSVVWHSSFEKLLSLTTCPEVGAQWLVNHNEDIALYEDKWGAVIMESTMRWEIFCKC